MIGSLRSALSGDGMKARVMRGSMVTFFGFGGSQALRLASNLILTRLLFPEAFGLMAIVQLFLVGLQMFSDIGLNSVIIQSKRGEDPVFLNTCWTLQIIRGAILGAVAVAIANPVAEFYNEPMLRELMPAVGLTAVIQGFVSTRILTESRKIVLGRLTLLELCTQVLGIVFMVVLALALESVWALMGGVIFGTAMNVILSHLILPGHPNRLQLERAAFLEQFNYGKFILLSSAMSFLVTNGDRIVLSKSINLADLGFYTIAFYFAAMPILIMERFVGRIFFPLYSSRPPSASVDNRRAISRVRFIITGSMFALLLFLGLFGEWLVRLLYSAEYQLAGPILVMLTIGLMPKLIFQTYGFILLSKGGSKVFAAYQCFAAVVQTSLLVLGVQQFGMIGAIMAPAVSSLITYPVLMRLIRPYHGADWLHDVVFGLLTLFYAALIVSLNDNALTQILAISAQ